ncbi:plant UBX domain-containing protein 2 [Primulina eburnea]|uniref:plant UBX domain-containing protein 2 n=1 Tax=Primulina eburnea TaxID=1245227 RepID=UPI003C6BD6AA
MDDVKDKMKGLMKKVKNPFSSSNSGKFEGQGRVLGSSSSPDQSVSSSFFNSNALPQKTNNISEPLSRKVSNSSEQKLENKKPEILANKNGNEKDGDAFDPFNSLITSGKRNPHGYSLKVFECPVCSKVYSSEQDVSAHVESCLSSADLSNENGGEELVGSETRLQDCVSAYVSGKPKDSSIEVVMRLFKNVVADPENAKFRKIRLGNPKIKEAIGDVPGGIELLECIGFELKEEGAEMWLTMEVPSEDQLGLVKKAISLLDPKKDEELPSTAPAKIDEDLQPQKVKVDRQVRVFFSVPESVAAKIELPDSFYNLSALELKREAEMRKKKLEDSKLLIPKSYREKQAKSTKKRYKRTVIRVQFPDGVVLQAIFSPSELTGALYEFVSSALKEPSLEFELLHPVLVKRRVIPHFLATGEKAVTLEDEDLVPAALVKFRPIETDTIVFTGLCDELLEQIEPLVPDSAVLPL